MRLTRRHKYQHSNYFEKANLPRLASVLFRKSLSQHWIITSPNRDCNLSLPKKPSRLRRLRHEDHKFEFSRAEFKQWMSSICDDYQLHACCGGIGPVYGSFGRPTNVAFFSQSTAIITEVFGNAFPFSNWDALICNSN